MRQKVLSCIGDQKISCQSIGFCHIVKMQQQPVSRQTSKLGCSCTLIESGIEHCTTRYPLYLAWSLCRNMKCLFMPILGFLVIFIQWLRPRTTTEGSRLMRISLLRISLLRFFKKFHKFALCEFWAILFHQCNILGKIAKNLHKANIFAPKVALMK